MVTAELSESDGGNRRHRWRFGLNRPPWRATAGHAAKYVILEHVGP